MQWVRVASPPAHRVSRKGQMRLRPAERQLTDAAWNLVAAHRRPLLLGLLLMIVARGAGFVLPICTKLLIDTVIGQKRPDLLLPVVLAAIAATLIQGASAFAVARVVSIAAQRAIRDLRIQLQQHVIRLPIAFFDGTKSGGLISRILNDPQGLQNLVGTGVLQLAGGIFTTAFALSILIWIDWQLTLSIVALPVLFGALMTLAFKRLRPIFRERARIREQVAGRLGETLAGVRVVKLHAAEARETAAFRIGSDRLFRNVAATITASSAVAALTTVIVGAAGVLILLIGGRSILAGTMTLGDLIMYVYFLGLMVGPLAQIAGIGTQLSEAIAGLDRVREIRRAEVEHEGPAASRSVGQLRGDVRFEQVSFGYTSGERALANADFHAAPGTTTALVGPSGAGKSTLVNLLMAFHRPQTGRILVDGHDLAELSLREYRSQLGVVLQDNFLFDGPIRDSIAYARPDATDEEIGQAARIAHCHEFISSFPDGYATIVGERGVKLSGGQRQRVAIARAILADPRILILDEATSSLDSQSEASIQDGLRKLRAGRTTFVIAHRLSTIRGADQILVLDTGRIVERGTHRELIENAGLYRRLYEAQRGLEADLFMNPGDEPATAAQLGHAHAIRKCVAAACAE